jgi:hypothetical protein
MCKKSGNPLTIYCFIVKSRANYGVIFLICLVSNGYAAKGDQFVE